LYIVVPLSIVLSVLLRYTDSDYPFGIFKIFLPMLGLLVWVFYRRRFVIWWLLLPL